MERISCLLDRMVNSADIQNYLQRLQKKYEQWWKLYKLLNEEYEPFDFRVEVQTEEPVQENHPAQRSEKKTIPFPILDGIERYVAQEPVLVIGQPGSGKSTALVRYLLKAVEQARQDPQAPIPVLIELRRCKAQFGVLTLIQDNLKRLGVKNADIEELRVAGRPFLLLLDGLNELPSRQALVDLRNFREDCVDLGIPIVVTTRSLDGDNLGIERHLEVKSLTPCEIQRFFQTCLPQESKQRFQELSDRLRELGRTPLMLWMLYVVLREPQGKIPDSRGELFRQFIWIYERKREEKIYLDEDSRLDGETRRWWTRLLKPLAYEMMRSGKSGEPTDFRLEISKQDAEDICKGFLKAQEVNNYSDLAIRCLKSLIDHHLIQFDSEKQEIEFCHQLLQEYYAAECLLEQLDELSNEQLKYYFLNYLKWTEAIGLMLGLISEDDFGGCGREQAIRAVKLALGIEIQPTVDLMLGARLAGKVKESFHEQTIGYIAALDIPMALKIELLGETRSDMVVPRLIEAIEHSDFEIRWNAAEALEKNGNAAAISGLSRAVKRFGGIVRMSAVGASGQDDDPRSLQSLWQKQLKSQDYSIGKTITAIQKHCQFYNYEIATQTDPPPAVQPFISQEPANITINIEKAYGVAGNVEGDQIIHFPDRLLQQTPLKEQYEDILDTIYHTGREIERKPQTYQDMGEEALRNIFLATLNGKYRGCATGETFNKNGKTDILLRDEGRNLLIAECKIWGGAELLRKTLDQLLGYATWRDTQLAILIFNRNKNFSAILEQIPDAIKRCPEVVEHIPYTSHDETGFRFILYHPDDPKRELLLTILAFDIP